MKAPFGNGGGLLHMRGDTTADGKGVFYDGMADNAESPLFKTKSGLSSYMATSTFSAFPYIQRES